MCDPITLKPAKTTWFIRLLPPCKYISKLLIISSFFLFFRSPEQLHLSESRWLANNRWCGRCGRLSGDLSSSGTSGTAWCGRENSLHHSGRYLTSGECGARGGHCWYMCCAGESRGLKHRPQYMALISTNLYHN